MLLCERMGAAANWSGSRSDAKVNKVNKVCDSLSRLNELESVKTIVDNMSPNSMCCYELFRRNGSTSEGSGRSNANALCAGQHGNTSNPGKQIQTVLRGLQPGTNPLYESKGSVVHSLYGANNEGVLNQRLSLRPQPPSKASGSHTDRLYQLQGTYGDRGREAEVGHGCETGLASVAPIS